MSDLLTIPLFPLNCVLFPGGPLPLRIFETRYTDMVRRCMREQSPFGVVLIRAGAEAGEVARSADIGTLASIVDFNALPDGLLGITCIGGRRFRVQRRWRAADGLNMAEVVELPAAMPLPLADEYTHLSQLLRQLLPEMGDTYQFVKMDFDDTDWVSARFAEILPVELEVKQRWLEMDDPLDRLAEITPMIRRVPD